jgi:ABC-2 type transport system permease protein
VPDEYVKTKYNLLSMLKELEGYAAAKVDVVIHDNLEEFSKEATLAEERFGIRRQAVSVTERGESRREEFILGAAFTCGVEKVVVPFFNAGMPVEYELIRSIATVAQPQRRKLAVVSTDAQLNGGFTFAGGMPQQIPRQMVLEDLGRQYRIEDVSLDTPLDVYDDQGKLRYDALLVVQPSSLAPLQLQRLIDAIKEGQPTVIFEDPLPYLFGQLAGTSEDKQPPGGMFGMGAPPQPKGDSFQTLWDALDIDPVGEATLPRSLPGVVVCQAFNPYKRFAEMPKFGPYVFVRQDEVGSFNKKAPAVAGFEELFFPLTGAISDKGENDELSFTELVTTAEFGTSTIDVEHMRTYLRTGDEETVRQNLARTNRAYTIAAWIRGKEKEGAAADAAEDKKDAKQGSTKPEKSAKAAAKKEGGDDGKKESKGKDEKGSSAAQAKRPVSVIYVADVDCLHNQILEMRNIPGGEQFRWDNGPAILNLVDVVAGDDRFLAIRQRKPRYSTLQRVELVTQDARADEDKLSQEYQSKYDKEVAKQDENVKKIETELSDLDSEFERKRNAGQQIDLGEYRTRKQQLQLRLASAVAASEKAKVELRRELQTNLERIRRERDQQIRSVQNEYKIWSVAIPPIPPLLVGFFVFVRRRLKEREGISKARLRY